MPKEMTLSSDYAYVQVTSDKNYLPNKSETLTLHIIIDMVRVQYGDYYATSGIQVLLNDIEVWAGVEGRWSGKKIVDIQVTGFQEGLNIVKIKIGAMITQAQGDCRDSFDVSCNGADYTFSYLCDDTYYFLERVSCSILKSYEESGYNYFNYGLGDSIMENISWSGIEEFEEQVYVQEETKKSQWPLIIAGLAIVGSIYFLRKKRLLSRSL